MNHQKLSVGLWKFRKSNDYSWSRALANKCFRFVCERLADWCFRTYRRWIKGRPASVGGCTTSFCRRLYARCAWRTNVPQLSTIVPHHWPITFCFAFDATWVHSKNWNVHSRRTKGTTHTHTHRLFTRSFFISRALTLFRCRRRTRSFVHSIVCRQQICEMRAHAIYQHCAIPVSASVAVRQRQQQHDANGSARRLCRSGRRIIGSHRCFASYGDFHFHKFTVVFRRRHSAHHNHTYLHRVT